MCESGTPFFLKKSTRALSLRFFTGNEPNMSEFFQPRTPTANTQVLGACQPRSFAGEELENNASSSREKNSIRLVISPILLERRRCASNAGTRAPPELPFPGAKGDS